MSATDTLLRISHRVALPTLIRYLRSRGWKELEHANANIRVFGHEVDDSAETATVVVPERTNLADYSSRVAEAIQVVAEFERIPLSNVMDALLYGAYDVNRARLLDRGQKISSIPLEMAAHAIVHLRNFFAYAACTEAEPRPFFAKATSLAKEFAQLCRFGQTFEGSFGFTIECPLQLPAEFGLPGVPAHKPFERRVMERIANGYALLAVAVEKDDPSDLIKNYTHGFSANMCEALVELYETVEHRSIEYSVSWSWEVPVDKELMRGSNILLRGDAFQQLAYVAKELEKVSESAEMTITGPITALRSDEPPLDLEQETFEHTVTMMWEMEKSVFVRLRVPLSAGEYRVACDAHKEGRHISVRGTPEKQGKFWVLTLVSEFKVAIR